MNRDDLRCPFGCALWHCRESSTRRSVAYYRTAEGRCKKWALNRRRCLFSTVGSRAWASSADDDGPSSVVISEPAVACSDPLVKEDGSAEASGPVLDISLPIIKYIRMVTSMIEGRVVSFEEIGLMLRKILRQHGLTNRRRFDYIVEQLNKGPP